MTLTKLHEFISDSLAQIKKGVDEAKEKTNNQYLILYPEKVKFSVEVDGQYLEISIPFNISAP